MVGVPGRAITLEWDGVQLKGCREKGISLNGEAINTTSDENDGWRTLLDVSSENSIDINVSGVVKDDVLKRAYFGGSSLRTKTARLEYPDGSSIVGTFYLANYSETGPYNDATTFTATIQSANDDVVYTPAP